jgi:DNA-binding winged helix-turn-helix (wHTH) protein
VNSKRQDLRPDDPYPTCEFGEFRLDVQHRSLSRAGSAVPITARALDTLIYLIRHRGTLLTRETLIDLVWPDSDVLPNNLSQTIKKLRRLLGEKPGENRYIETVAGRGYRFIADLRVPAGTWGGTERSDVRPTLNAQAYEHYRHALRLIQRPTAENCTRAVELLQAASQLDPLFARAWAWLADARLFAINLGHADPKSLTLAEEHAHHALRLDSGLAQAHTVLGTIAAQRGEWLRSESHFRKATSLDPSDAKARSLHASMLLEQVGHVDRALHVLREAYRTVPDDPRMLVNLAMAHSVAGLDEEAIRYAALATAFGFPETALPLPIVYVHAAMNTGRFAEAAQRARYLLPEELRTTDAIDLTYQALDDACCRESAAMAMRQLIEHMPARLLPRSSVAVVLIEWCTQLGLLDLAFQLAERALDSFSTARPPSWQSLWARELLPLRQDARFSSLVGRLGFATYWRAHGPPDCPAVRGMLGL